MKRVQASVRVATLALLALSGSGAGGALPGQSPQTYASLFLEAKDLPDGLRMTQDARDKGADASDRLFTELNGQRAGLTVWVHPDTAQPVWRLVDIRWVFPDAEAAAKYLSASLEYLSEGAAEAPDAPKVGQDCHVFGPLNPKITQALRIELRAYTYVFRRGNVVVKLFVAQGMNSKERLRPATVESLAHKVLARLDTAGVADAPARTPGAAALLPQTPALLGQTEAGLGRTDFFTFFRLVESIRRPAGPTTDAMVTYQPSGSSFHDLVHVLVGFDTAGRASRIELRVDRAFIDDPAQRPFALDIISSLLRQGVPAGDHPAMAASANDVSLTVSGKRQAFEQRLNECRLSVANITDAGRPRLAITLERVLLVNRFDLFADRYAPGAARQAFLAR